MTVSWLPISVAVKPCEDLLWAQRDKSSRDFIAYTDKNNNVVILIQTFRRSLKELKPLYKRYYCRNKKL